ncbi:histidine kinase [Paractinoplanes atraurantiacus]|uniref:histidine kinase n=1 Tax=Paractinoplanes atraurantiacus TaxID=1036182 RepID=A0A285HHB0_9ACTN|nr:histidine kinase [Actinoplanes atraurantiacus]SNY34993.1 Signal transduction histidine kinase [Actinoplanes atraurantiacus]
MLKRDVLLGVVLAAPVVAHQATRGSVAGCVAALVTAVAATVSARRWPLAGWLVVMLATIVDGNFSFGIPVLSYLVGLRTERIRPVAVAFAAIAAGGTALNLGVLGVGPAEWFELAMFLLLLGVFPWLAGRYQAQRRRLESAGWERAARLESERRMVVLRERSHIAREMHDSLGHELALIALGAGALETSPDLPEEKRAAAARIRESAATATDQLREIIGVLREANEAAPLEPADEPVEDLAGRARAAGMEVTVERTGAGAPPTVERAACRVVRESLTNASRHAPGAPVAVGIRHTAAATTVTVVNAPAGSTQNGTAKNARQPATKNAGKTADKNAGHPATTSTENTATRSAGHTATPSAGHTTATTIGHAVFTSTGHTAATSIAHAAATSAGNTATTSAGHAAAGGAGHAAAGGAGHAAAGGAGHSAAGGTGIVGLRERVRLTGGTLTAGPTPDGGFRLEAVIPHRAAPAPEAAEMVHARRQVRRSLAAAIVTPAALAVVTSVAYYSFASGGSVLDEDAFARITLGTPRAELAAVLPSRQAWTRDPESSCEYYSDGSFPLAGAAYRLCFADGRLTRKDRLE